jgi:hypothetical protein
LIGSQYNVLIFSVLSNFFYNALRVYFYYHCNYCAKERYSKDLVNETFESMLDDFSFTSEVKVIYQLMVKDLLNCDAKDSKLQLEKLKNSIAETNVRIEKLQDLLVDGKIDSKSIFGDNDQIL